MSFYRNRLSEFQKVLETDRIDFHHVRRLCFNGIPDDSGYRPLCWKLLLNFLTSQVSVGRVPKKQRETYDNFVRETVVNLGLNENHDLESGAMLEDHPLNPNPESKWVTFFKDNEVLLQIDKDVRRLCPDISFFQQATEFPCKLVVENPHVETLRKRVEQTVLNSANVTRNRLGITNITLSRKRAIEEYQPLPPGEEAHWEVVERILFIYAKLNPGQSYVQGMNEIIGPIYYSFACDPNVEWRRKFLSHQIVFNNINKINFTNRPKLMVRGSAILLSLIFLLSDVIRIWDSLLADSSRFSFLIHVCCAMMILLRDLLLAGDFPTNLKLLQNFPEMDIHKVLQKAVELQR
ncbi:LOW QUALITY PROTEIN: TBC1 domain family member 13-like [Limulus polyphemus]|uniref:LOW QUALITY PROTEIN: TBC1 domain family member 13-like n=1 Tax=Limulus polyphemus TaxID=6850 RepID=A0ABM1TKE1_LIMPO|nr:LOW QUALITY PROTEIN: TBC1 domain family member 13-like [Limulus polyphemus]